MKVRSMRWLMARSNGKVQRRRHRSIGITFQPILSFKKAPISLDA